MILKSFTPRVISTTILVIFGFFPTTLFSWNNHAGITYFLLKDYWKQEPLVKVESLQNFLQKERKELLPFLEELQKEVVLLSPHYPKEILPEVRESFLNPKSGLTQAFWESLRLNSTHKASLYYQAFQKEEKGKTIPLEEITILKDKGKLPLDKI